MIHVNTYSQKFHSYSNLSSHTVQYNSRCSWWNNIWYAMQGLWNR